MSNSSVVIEMVNSIERSAKVIVPKWGDFERADVEQLSKWIAEAKDIEYVAAQLQRVFKKQQEKGKVDA